MLKQRYSNYFSFDYTTYNNVNTIASKRKALMDYQPIVDEFVCSNTFNIIDKANDSMSKILVEKLHNKLSEFSNSVEVSRDYEKNCLNLVVIHDKDYYKDSKVNDPHNEVPDNCIVQHITIENQPNNNN